jgi:hypothetical protein
MPVVNPAAVKRRIVFHPPLIWRVRIETAPRKPIDLPTVNFANDRGVGGFA